jgi:hypothetical protein
VLCFLRSLTRSISNLLQQYLLLGDGYLKKIRFWRANSKRDAVLSARFREILPKFLFRGSPKIQFLDSCKLGQKTIPSSSSTRRRFFVWYGNRNSLCNWSLQERPGYLCYQWALVETGSQVLSFCRFGSNAVCSSASKVQRWTSTIHMQHSKAHALTPRNHSYLFSVSRLLYLFRRVAQSVTLFTFQAERSTVLETLFLSNSFSEARNERWAFVHSEKAKSIAVYSRGNCQRIMRVYNEWTVLSVDRTLN